MQVTSSATGTHPVIPMRYEEESLPEKHNGVFHPKKEKIITFE
jgi:hypothetical protein